MDKKYFTVAEANALLPEIIREVEGLQDIKTQFETKMIQAQKLRSELTKSNSQPLSDMLFTLECEIEFLQIEARTLIQSVGMKGAELKDIASGLVDFPAVIDGEEVLLCWRQGEERITHYHGMYDGFIGRKPIPE